MFNRNDDLAAEGALDALPVSAESPIPSSPRLTSPSHAPNSAATEALGSRNERADNAHAGCSSAMPTA